jgi:transglutaminase-like putative cysteine protease
MSRLEFRVAVDTPRPRAAVAMVALASATLAITGQIHTWALGVALLALGWAAARGLRPAPWQRERWLLNGALAACLAAALVVGWLGEARIVALAHFALLAQALQLVDARPRRTEFLLVALAVFQVTLAANLTDSVFFPPLLVAFTVAAVWTLVVHTLRAEALEAGDPDAARRALSRGLERTTILASLCCVLLSLTLFPLLPRVRSGTLFARGYGATVARSGFSERVELGDIGRIRLDPTRVMRVTTLEGPVASPAERYWRGLAFDRFDGRRWSITPSVRSPVQGDPEIGVDLGGPRRRGSRAVQQIAREELPSGVLFTPGLPAAFRGAVGRLERDANRSLHAPAAAGKRVLYHVVSELLELPDAALAAERAAAPNADARYLQLPAFDPRVAALAREITARAETDAARVRAVESWLRGHGVYTDAPPDFGARGSPVEGFLLERTEGHCEYFASAMVVLLRSVGVPARIVNGFAGGEVNPVGGFLEVAQSDAHTWVEVPFEDSGWVRYDPTPLDLRLASAAALRDSAGFGDLVSTLELWWFRNVVDFDRGHQARAVRSVWLAWHRWRRGGPSPALEDETDPFAMELPTAPLVGIALTGLLAGALLADLRRRRLRRPERLPAAYARALRLLARRGHVRGASQTARDFSAGVATRLPRAGAAAFGRLTEAYLAERFGGRGAADAGDALRALRDSLRAPDEDPALRTTAST